MGEEVKVAGNVSQDGLSESTQRIVLFRVEGGRIGVFGGERDKKGDWSGDFNDDKKRIGQVRV